MNSYENHKARIMEDPEFRFGYEHPDLPMAAALVITRARVDAGMSHQELAERAGLSERRVRYLEAGEADLRLSELQRLYNALGIAPRLEGDKVPEFSKLQAEQTRSREPVSATG